MINDLGIKDRVVFKGLIPHDDMPQLLTDAVMLALSRPNNKQAKYGFPTKLGEYLLTGNPVVVTNVGDIPLFIKDRENGMVAEPDDVCGFAERIEWLLEHEEDAISIGKRGRDLALSNFNCMIEAVKIPNYILKA